MTQLRGITSPPNCPQKIIPLKLVHGAIVLVSQRQYAHEFSCTPQKQYYGSGLDPLLWWHHITELYYGKDRLLYGITFPILLPSRSVSLSLSPTNVRLPLYCHFPKLHAKTEITTVIFPTQILSHIYVVTYRKRKTKYSKTIFNHPG